VGHFYGKIIKNLANNFMRGGYVDLAIVGYGYWGPNLLRNFSKLDGVKIKWIGDIKKDRIGLAEKHCPTAQVSTKYQDIIESSVNAVAISTPVDTHYKLAKIAISKGKNVFIEKPMTSSVEQAEELIYLADKMGVVLMVDHTYVYTGAVRKIKELSDSNELGEILYFDSIRVNLGLFQRDINVVWDLAPHDLSIIDYLFGGIMPSSVNATGLCHFKNNLENIAFITLNYPDQNMIAHLNVNWLSPVKIRLMLMGSSKKMVVFDDMETTEKVKVYDKGVLMKSYEKEVVYESLIQYRIGDMWAPKIDQREALDMECEHFIDCIKTGKRPITDGQAGLRIVRILEAAEKSIKKRGEAVML
jgi:predicted dehydrogenase